MSDLLVENIYTAFSKMCICILEENIRKMIKLEPLYGKKKSKTDIYAIRFDENVYLAYAEGENVISIKCIRF